MIGGTDLVFAGEWHREDVLEVVRRAWPELIVEEENEHEFFVFKTLRWQESWSAEGRTPENTDTMVHILLGPTFVTCVVGGPETATLFRSFCCVGCGGPRLREGPECSGCKRRRRAFFEARGTTEEEVQRWTDGCDDEEG